MRRITRFVVAQYVLRIQRETKVFLRKKNACRIIQKKWRQTNRLDPISLTRIIHPVLIFRHNIPILYGAETLREYILLTGDLKDPVCRTCFSAEELIRIDSILPVKPLLISLFSTFKDLNERYVLNLSLADALEREMFRYILELGESNEQEAFNKFHNENASILYQCFSNYKVIDRDRCRISLKNILGSLNNHIPKKTHPRLNVYLRNLLYTFQADVVSF